MPTPIQAEAECASEEREAFKVWNRLRKYVREEARKQARCDVLKTLRPAFGIRFPDALPERLECLLQSCEKEAHEIACEAAEEASNQAPRASLRLGAYDAAYVEAYGDALPALMGTAIARRDVPDRTA